MHGDLSIGRVFLDAHLALLENAYELYLHAREATRRKLNWAMFAQVYIAHDEVVGDDIRSPLRELLAAERGWENLTAGATSEMARSPGRDIAPQRPRNTTSCPGRPGRTIQTVARPGEQRLQGRRLL